MLNNVLDFAKRGMVTGGASKNRIFFEKFIQVGENLDRAMLDLMFDPQTSGGLLVSLQKEEGNVWRVINGRETD